jgi:hypothetical protein
LMELKYIIKSSTLTMWFSKTLFCVKVIWSVG